MILVRRGPSIVRCVATLAVLAIPAVSVRTAAALVVSKCALAGRYRSAPFWFRYARACGWHQSDAINALCCGLCKIMSWIEKALYGLSGGLVGRFLHGAYQPCSRRCDGFRVAVASSVGGVWLERVKHATFNTCAPGASFRN